MRPLPPIVREFSRLDIVLGSAGIAHRLDFLDVDAETWDTRHRGQPDRHVHIGQATARQMVKQGGGGSIISVTSCSPRWHGLTRHYVASKERRPLADACDGGRSGGPRHRVNAIAPGPTLTGLTLPDYTDPEARRATEAWSRSGRLGQPTILSARCCSASDRVALGNRQHVTVDGSYLAIERNDRRPVAGPELSAPRRRPVTRKPYSAMRAPDRFP